MSDRLNNHEKDMADKILIGVTSGLNADLSHQTDEIFQNNYRECVDESANAEFADEYDSSIDNQQPTTSYDGMEYIENDWSSKFFPPKIDSPRKYPESPVKFKEESKTIWRDDLSCDKEKDVAVMEESLKEKTHIRETSMDNINNSEDESQDICSLFETKLKWASSEKKSDSPPTSDISKMKRKLCFKDIFTKGIKPTKVAKTSDVKTDAADQRHNEKKAVSDKTLLEDSLDKNECKPVKISSIDNQTNLGFKQLFYSKSDSKFSPKPGPSKDLSLAQKSEPKNHRHGLATLQRCHSTDSTFDSDQRTVISSLHQKPAGDKQTDCKSNALAFSELATKGPVKRKRGSQSDVPRIMYRRRSVSTRDVETGEVNASRRHLRCVSADSNKCSADSNNCSADGQNRRTVGSEDDLKLSHTRKRKFDKGSKAMIKELSCVTKKLKPDVSISEMTNEEISNSSNSSD